MEKGGLGAMGAECNSNQTAPPCANNCGFYGSPANLNFCSKCYQEHLKSTQASAPNVSAKSLTNINNLKTKGSVEQLKEKFATLDSKSPVTSAKSDDTTIISARNISEDKVGISSFSGSTLNASAPADATTNGENDEKIKQTDVTRCWDCGSRVGLLGFRCRCGYTFCKKHRQTEAHGCTFDFLTFHQEQLKRSNQKVVADKLERI